MILIWDERSFEDLSIEPEWAWIKLCCQSVKVIQTFSIFEIFRKPNGPQTNRVSKINNNFVMKNYRDEFIYEG